MVATWRDSAASDRSRMPHTRRTSWIRRSVADDSALSLACSALAASTLASSFDGSAAVHHGHSATLSAVPRFRGPLNIPPLDRLGSLAAAPDSARVSDGIARAPGAARGAVCGRAASVDHAQRSRPSSRPCRHRRQGRGPVGPAVDTGTLGGFAIRRCSASTSRILSRSSDHGGRGLPGALGQLSRE